MLTLYMLTIGSVFIAYLNSKKMEEVLTEMPRTQHGLVLTLRAWSKERLKKKHSGVIAKLINCGPFLLNSQSSHQDAHKVASQIYT